MSAIVLRDLESVLKSHVSKELIVKEFSTEALLPPGENYGSTILSVVAKIKRNEDAELETLHLVAKMLPPTAFQREMFDSGYTFRKESFFYEGILPSYQKLQQDLNIKREEMFDIAPKFYGVRYSSNPDLELNEDCVLLMENLRERGYYTGDRKLGLPLDHVKFALEALAKFHALGMAVKYKRPDEFEALKVRCKCFQLKSNVFTDITNSLLNELRSDKEMSKYLPRIEPFLIINEKHWIEIPQEPWSTIIHSDFWVNNMLFHKNSNNQVDDIKFVDFQNYLFSNPLRELIFFVSTSMNTDLLRDNIDTFLDLYYETLLSILKRINCSVSLLMRDAFDREIKKCCKLEYIHCLFMIKVMTLDVEEDMIDINKLNALEFGKCNTLTFQRIRKITSVFMGKGWI